MYIGIINVKSRGKTSVFWYLLETVPFFMNTLNVIYRVPIVTEHFIFIPGKVMGNDVVHVNVYVSVLLYLIGKISIYECNLQCVGQMCESLVSD